MKTVTYLILVNVILRCSLGENLKLLILHNNDMHSRFEETSRTSGICKDKSNCYGGFARVLHVVRQARKAAADGTGPPVLFLNAGDTYTGTAWFSVHKWKIAADFLNLLHPDVASFGNHEFDFNITGLLPFLKNISFPIVAANMDFALEPELLMMNISKSIVIDIHGHKVGVVGYLTPDTVHLAETANIVFRDEVDAIKEESEMLHRNGVNIIIALGHSGFITDKKIAKEVPLVDVVIGGHTNTFLYTGSKPDLEEPEGPYPTLIEQINGKVVPVVQAFAFTKYMGRLLLTFDDSGDLVEVSGQPQLLDSSILQDDEALELLDTFKQGMQHLLKTIGTSKVLLDGSEQSCRHRECNFGNLVTDSFVAYHAANYDGAYWTDTPISFLNGGTLRSIIESGDVTVRDVYEVIPYKDQIVSMSLNGSTLLDVLEHSVRSNGETSFGEFLQTSGLHYSFNRTRPVGSRILEAKARCGLCRIPVYEPLVLDKTYRIITRKFLSIGGDNYSMLKYKAYDKIYEDQNMIDIVMWYINRISPIELGEDDRITSL